nr:SH3 domain-containing protein [Marivibrio halodurans]
MLVGGMVLSSGCQTADSLTRELGLRQIASDDLCGRHSEELRGSKSYFERNIVQGAVIGAVGGALIGALITGDVGGALRGGLVGAAAGAGGGYLSARQREAEDRASLTRTVYQDSARESAQVVRALNSFSAARQCRIQTAERVKRDFKAGRLTREQAQQALDTERARYNDDITTVRAIGARVDERHQELVAAAETLSSGDPEARELLAEAKAAEREAWSNPNLQTSESVSAPPPGADGYPVRRYAETNLNVRAAPSAGSERLTLLQGGQGVLVLAPASDGWATVQLDDGRRAYVAAQFLRDDSGTVQVASNASVEPTLASLTRSVPNDASVETKTVGVMFEGREKRLELERLARRAEREEDTVFSLDG